MSELPVIHPLPPRPADPSAGRRAAWLGALIAVHVLGRVLHIAHIVVGIWEWAGVLGYALTLSESVVVSVVLAPLSVRTKLWLWPVAFVFLALIQSAGEFTMFLLMGGSEFFLWLPQLLLSGVALIGPLLMMIQIPLWIAWWLGFSFHRPPEGGSLEEELHTEPAGPMQFSIWQLIVATAAVAVLLAIGRVVAPAFQGIFGVMSMLLSAVIFVPLAWGSLALAMVGLQRDPSSATFWGLLTAFVFLPGVLAVEVFVLWIIFPVIHIIFWPLLALVGTTTALTGLSVWLLRASGYAFGRAPASPAVAPAR